MRFNIIFFTVKIIIFSKIFLRHANTFFFIENILEIISI